MKNVRLPMEVAETISRFRQAKLSGSVTINFSEGKPQSLKLIQHEKLQIDTSMQYPQEVK